MRPRVLYKRRFRVEPWAFRPGVQRLLLLTLCLLLSLATLWAQEPGRSTIADRSSAAQSASLPSQQPREPRPTFRAPRNEIDGVLPFVPTARRTFTQADAVSAFVQVSQGTSRTSALTPVTLTMRIVDVRDQVVRQQSSTLDLKAFSSNRTANSKLAIPIGGLAAGQYLLRLDATIGKKSLERMVRFSIE